MGKYHSWSIKECNSDKVKQVMEEVNLHPLVAELLVKKGIDNPEEIKTFLECDLRNSYDPFIFPDMQKAVDRILKAQEKREKILVYGDYDVDGITATAILLENFRKLGLSVDYFLPNRLSEGYGLNREALEEARAKNISLIITVDCGITSVEEVKIAQELGIDVIITDHHLEEKELPPAFAVIDPHLAGTYPFTGLAGSGVAYKLAQAVSQHLGKEKFPQGLDLVALGTISDIVPLLGENRLFVKAGLHELKTQPRAGVQALMDIAGVIAEELDTTKISFRLGPLLNALGRLGDARDAVTLLLTKDKHEAENLSRMMEDHNQERRNLQDSNFMEIKNMINENLELLDQKALVFWGKNWHRGVLGIVASKISSMYNRPVILLSLQDGRVIGSGRSVPGFHIVEALEKCREFLVTFGGHEMAAGLEVEEKNIEAFAKAFAKTAEETIKSESLKTVLKIDAEAPLSLWDIELFESLELLQPWGHENPEPIFMANRVNASENPRIVGDNHLKLLLKESGKVFAAIAFGQGDALYEKNLSRVDIAYAPYINRFQGRESLEMKIIDIRDSAMEKKVEQNDNSLEKAKKKMDEFLKTQPSLPKEEPNSISGKSSNPWNITDQRNSENKLDYLSLLVNPGFQNLVVCDHPQSREIISKTVEPFFQHPEDENPPNFFDMKGFSEGETSLFIGSYETVSVSEKVQIDADLVIFYDLPKNPKIWAKIIDSIKKKKKETHLLYHSSDLEIDKGEIPQTLVTRENLGEFYRALKTFSPTTGIPTSAWEEFLSSFPNLAFLADLGIKIFSELELLQVESNGTIHLTTPSGKKDLSSSQSFKDIQKIQVFKELAFSEISKWPESLLETFAS